LLLQRLSVFAGGWTLDAAEAICAGDGITPEAVLDLLAGLVAKSLVLLEEGSAGARYRMLETVRQYGQERLAAGGGAAGRGRHEATGELDEVRHQHASYFLALAMEAFPHTFRSDQVMWLERLEDELPNLRAAWGWCEARGQAGEKDVVERGMQAAGYLCLFWILRGHIQEGEDWLARLLAVPGAQTRTCGRAIALCCLGFLRAMRWGDLSTGEAVGEEGVAIARELGDQRDLALALFCWGAAYAFFSRPGTGDLVRGRAYLEEAITLFEVASDDDSRALLAGMYVDHGAALFAAGELKEAETQLTRGMELAKATGSGWNIAVALEWLGYLALAQGDPTRARALLDQALVHHGAIRNQFGIGTVLTRLGEILQRTGDPVAARGHYARALRALHAIGHIEVSHQALCGLAELASEDGELAHALTLVAVATVLAKVAGVQPSPPVQARLKQVRATAVQALSAEEQGVTWAAGQMMPLEQVIAEELAR
jgi:non-specific serine/threonine protein kinase